jgi:hypothetical protein
MGLVDVCVYWVCRCGGGGVCTCGVCGNRGVVCVSAATADDVECLKNGDVAMDTWVTACWRGVVCGVVCVCVCVFGWKTASAADDNEMLLLMSLMLLRLFADDCEGVGVCVCTPNSSLGTGLTLRGLGVVCVSMCVCPCVCVCCCSLRTARDFCSIARRYRISSWDESKTSSALSASCRRRWVRLGECA